MKPSASENELIQAVIETLNQGEALLAQMSDETYTRKLPVAFNASVGGHYRHCLDHFRSLLDAAPAGDLNYDHRERGTMIENDRFAALNATRELRDDYERLDVTLLTRPFVVTCKTSYATSGSQISPSTVGREIMYSVAHAVHHYALIGIMAGLMGVTLPAGFGVAPSTIKHQKETAATPIAPPEKSERVVRGYKVRAHSPTSGPEERKAKEDIAIRLMAETMKRPQRATS